jgi:hypothetical protein
MNKPRKREWTPPAVTRLHPRTVISKAAGAAVLADIAIKNRRLADVHARRRNEIAEGIKRLFNCRVCEITLDGDVRIADPQSSRWLYEDELRLIAMAWAKGDM